MNMAREPRLLTVEEFDMIEQDDKLRYELLDGAIYMLSRPGIKHIECHDNLVRDIGQILRGKQCRNYSELELQIGCDTILIPDIMIICNRDQFTNQRYLGIPLIVIEILSPSTMRSDMLYKLNKYQSIGVSEYWIVNPKLQVVSVYDFAGDGADIYTVEDIIQSKALPEIIILVSHIFE